jgi:hypothetical protein
MVVSGSVLGPEPAGWPVKDLRVNKIAQDRFKAKADVDAYVMTQKPTKIVYDVWNPFDTRGVGNMGGNESLYSLDRIERLETLRQLGLPIPDTVAPGEEDIYITSVLSDYGVGSLEQWLNMTAKQREETIEEANKRGRESRPTAGGKPFTTSPMDDDPFEKISQGFQNLSSVLAQGYFQTPTQTVVPGSPQQAGSTQAAGKRLNEAQTNVRNARRAYKTNPTPAKKQRLEIAQDANRTAQQEFDKSKDNVKSGKKLRSGRQIIARTPTKQ